MIRKYGIGLLALIIAVGAVAFTKPGVKGKGIVTYTFRYTQNSYLQQDVEANSNWVSGAGSGCGSFQNKACQMEVDEQYTHLSGRTRVLNTTGNVLIISAALGVNNTDYVPNPGASTGVVSANNKP
jgi:hypothetical protein